MLVTMPKNLERKTMSYKHIRVEWQHHPESVDEWHLISTASKMRLASIRACKTTPIQIITMTSHEKVLQEPIEQTKIYEVLYMDCDEGPTYKTAEQAKQVIEEVLGITDVWEKEVCFD